MKFFTPSALAATALVSLAAVVPFLPAARNHVDRFAMEARLTSTVSGYVQVYYDTGEGFRESDSARTPIASGSQGQVCRLSLPPGIYRTLRFDPIDSAGVVTIEAARIVDAADHDLRDIAPHQFKPMHQIRSLREIDGRLEAVASPGGNDPQLLLEFDPPLRLEVSWISWAIEWLRPAAGVFLALALGLLALDRSIRLRTSLVAGGRWITAKPGRAVSMTAAVAVIISAYPVIFLGQSYVSPNFGTHLLYDGFPTLPGYTSQQVSDVKGSDIGAIMWQHVPYSMIQHRALWRDHELPVWNRYNSGGQPMLGQGQSMFGDPLQLLPVAADGAAWAWDLKYLVAKWLFAVGLGLLVLAVARHLPAALIVSLAAPFVGFFVYRVNHPAYFSLCYAPWPLYCWVRATRATGRRATAGWLAGLILGNLALLASGTVKEAYMLLLTMNFTGACVLLADTARWRTRLAKLAAALWAEVLFVLITAPLWGAFLVTLENAYTSYNAVSAYQIQPGMLLGAFDEAFYRPLSQGEMVFNPSVNFLILAGLLYFLATLRHHFSNRMAVTVAAASLLPLGLAFGLVPPAWIIRVPFLGNVAHIDNSFTCSLIVLWAVLAGVGFAAAARRLGKREGRDDLVIAAILLFALVFAFVGFGQAVQRSVFGPGVTYSPLSPGQSIPVSTFVWCYLASLLAATVVIGFLARRALQRHSLTPAGALILVLGIGALLWRQGQQAGWGFPDYVVHPAVRVDLQAPSAAVAFVQKAETQEPGRAIGLRDNLFPGWTDVYGLEGVSGPDALINPNYRELSLVSPLDVIWDWRLYLASDDLTRARRFLDFLNVRYYFDQKSDQRFIGSRLRLDRSADLEVYKSPTAWPRAFFTDRVVSYDQPEQLMRQILHGDGRPFAAVTPGEIESNPVLAYLPDDLSTRAIVPATQYRLTEDSTSFDIDAPAAGLVVLDETFWPGYSHAEVDGRAAPVVRVNDAFQGITVDTSGLHHVTVRYRPRKFRLLLALSALGLALLASSGWYSRRSTS